jgi:hypothetical protein
VECPASNKDDGDPRRILSDADAIADTDTVSPACKIGVVLDPIEAVRLMGILASAECVRGLSKATGKKE